MEVLLAFSMFALSGVLILNFLIIININHMNRGILFCSRILTPRLTLLPCLSTTDAKDRGTDKYTHFFFYKHNVYKHIQAEILHFFKHNAKHIPASDFGYILVY